MKVFGLPVPGWAKGEKDARAARRKARRLRRNRRRGESMPQGTVRGDR